MKKNVFALIDIAVKIMNGTLLSDLDYKHQLIPNKNFYAVKAPVFSMSKLTGVDTFLGPEMKSTGEVMGIDNNFQSALSKALISSQLQLPRYGKLLLSIADRDKKTSEKLIKLINSKGYNFAATPGTADLIESLGFPSERIENLLTEILGDDLLVTKMGDTRFDQIIYRKSNNKKNLLPNFYNNSNNVIFGSYDDYDEKIIVKSLERVFPNGDEDLKKKNIGIILVPHEINQNKINMLIRQLKNQSIECNTLSNSANFKSNVIIIDTVGILADLYKYTKLAYVGSGFTTGVHSVIEPAVYGCTIGHGPNFELLDEAKEMQKNNISYTLKSTTDMVDFINYIDNKNKLFNRNKVIDFISQSSGTTDKIIQRMGL